MLQDQTRRRKISIPQQLLAPRDERCHRLTLLWTEGTAKLGRLRFSGGASSICWCQRRNPLGWRGGVGQGQGGGRWGWGRSRRERGRRGARGCGGLRSRGACRLVGRGRVDQPRRRRRGKLRRRCRRRAGRPIDRDHGERRHYADDRGKPDVARRGRAAQRFGRRLRRPTDQRRRRGPAQADWLVARHIVAFAARKLAHRLRFRLLLPTQPLRRVRVLIAQWPFTQWPFTQWPFTQWSFRRTTHRRTPPLAAPQPAAGSLRIMILVVRGARRRSRLSVPTFPP